MDNLPAITTDQSSSPALTRNWRYEPDGPNDREVDIWFNNGWVPAFFSDIKKGDFFLDVKLGTPEKGRCFMSTSDVRRSISCVTGYPSFIIQGLEIVQAPAIVDINPLPILELK